MAFGDQDIPTFLSTKGFGVPVVFNGITTPGILDTYETRTTLTQVDIVERERTVQIQTGSLPGLKNESTLTIDGVRYMVRDVLQSADGALTHVFVVPP